jgi:hypothetical protein
MNIANSFPAALLLLTLLAPAYGQTNFFPLLKVGDKTYTNATITRVNPAEATVIFDGGGAQVAVSNLPPELRERYHYDPQTAARFLAEQRERKAALKKMDAETAARAASVSEPVLIKVMEIDAGSEKALTDMGLIWLRNIPAQTAQYLAGRIQLADEIQALTSRIEINERDAQYAHALAATNAYYNYINPFYGADVMGQMHAANVMSDNVNNEKIELERLSKALDDYTHQGEHLATIRATKTAKQYLGMPIWISLGPGPVPTAEQHPQPEAAQQPQ